MRLYVEKECGSGGMWTLQRKCFVMLGSRAAHLYLLHVVIATSPPSIMVCII